MHVSNHMFELMTIPLLPQEMGPVTLNEGGIFGIMLLAII
jgi:hypothetical protein